MKRILTLSLGVVLAGLTVLKLRGRDSPPPQLDGSWDLAEDNPVE